MFEGLEKGWTEDKRGWPDKALLALPIVLLILLSIGLVFEPGKIVHPGAQKFLMVLFGLALIVVNVRLLISRRKANRHQSK